MQAQKELESRTIPFWKRIFPYISYLLEGKQADHKQNTIAALDGVRAIACLIVVAFHLSLITTRDVPLWTASQFNPLFSAVAFAGDTGVNLFFVLSGFLLFMPFASAILWRKPRPSWKRFYLRRIFRILPAYYVSLLLMILLFRPNYLSIHHWQGLLSFLFLFIDSSADAYKQINGPFWTLAVEWQFYLALPFIALGIAFLVERCSQRSSNPRIRLGWIIGSLLVLAAWGVFSRWLGIYLVANPQLATTRLTSWLINLFLFFGFGAPVAGLHGKFMEDFAMGMLVSTLYIYTQSKSGKGESQYPITLASWLGRLSPVLFVFALLWQLAMFAWKFAQSTPQAFPFFTQSVFTPANYATYAELGYGIGYGLLILAILFGRSWLKRPFEWTPLRWLGLLSYGLYMWHLNLVRLPTSFVARHPEWPALLRYSVYWGWFAIFIIPLVFLLFVAVERPFIQFGARLTKATKKQAAPHQEEPPATMSSTVTVEDTHSPGLSEPGPAHIH
ncbi:hypothetical protein KSD_25610 [Ktedonobacter sp. SOSP1-85]|uniref:acyltransferase family protein n=1 Tax=Ktedonobacter sp. SOSP1-85 TaxID=2778367 RepID=UPI001915F0FC|nr:acyltransferase [Ktedonobacter sp. SOSP1-85]GHO74790.1 hypothetical protein KSD_25610 [Ktedonobacter sp. SOSP1-85]